ncbi:PREDICTED: ras association domain-containing protein 5-like [Priapulus caudatus]|uniref:Ras association domain-containing protein 5-like n=1 Tax=Priapulus caudatus TaxID=37621 RepID=A0ABM1F1D8_PRICU|nr:PREDICTED: ras association domain-containing protein 5-like [Priapulus caudatus]
MPLNNATWCDLCGDLIWGLLNNNCLRCYNCNYTCHHKCRQLVSLDCTNPLREMPAETSLISQLIEEQPSPSTTLSSLSNGSVVSCVSIGGATIGGCERPRIRNMAYCTGDIVLYRRHYI